MRHENPLIRLDDIKLRLNAGGMLWFDRKWLGELSQALGTGYSLTIRKRIFVVQRAGGEVPQHPLVNRRRRPSPILELETLSDSSYYYWLKKIGKLYQLCIWAAWHKARKHGVGITYDAIFGDRGFVGYVYRDTRTDEMIVGFDHPGDGYESYGEFFNSRKSSFEIDRGDKLYTGIELSAIAVNDVLFRRLGRDTREEILNLLPFTGKFKGDALPFDEKSSIEKLRSARDKISSSEESLRDCMKPRHKIVKDDYDYLLMEMDRVFHSKAIKAAISALEEKAPLLPRDFATQKTFEMAS